MAVLLAIGYQFWNRRKKSMSANEDEIMETLKGFSKHEAKMGRNNFGGELDSLKTSLDSLSKSTERLTEDTGNIAGKAFSRGGYDDDAY